MYDEILAIVADEVQRFCTEDRACPDAGKVLADHLRQAEIPQLRELLDPPPALIADEL